MDSGRALFERLRIERWDLVREWADAKEAETLHLEFKRKGTPSTASIEDGDKGGLAKTLSALANVEGGLLVLGIGAGGGGRETFDRVEAVQEIADVESFGSAVEKRLATLTDPPIAGLRVQAVESPTNRGRGIVGVYVPPSNGRPHRATNATKEVNDKYYMRTGAGSVVMPHALLGALFAYSLPPRLEFRARFLRWEVNESLGPWVELRLANRGRSPARRPAVHLLGPPPLKWPQTPEVFRVRHQRTEEDQNYVALEPVSADFVIYPGSDAVLATVRCERGAFGGSGGINLGFHARIMSLDSQTFEGESRLDIGPVEQQADAMMRRAVIGPDLQE